MKKSIDLIKRSVLENIALKKNVIKQSKKISILVDKIFDCLNNKGKVFICGNGGSASDAQHLAAEMMVRLNPNVNRRPYPVISLALDISTLTAISNDYNFNKIYDRTLDALATKADLLITISTSGNSKNIINVLKKAKKKKIFSISFLGNKGGSCKNLSDLSYVVPSNDVARIQETHIFIGHLILNLVEKKLIK
jgi:D-sedoheptulose 7-phosphate isomerase